MRKFFDGEVRKTSRGVCGTHKTQKTKDPREIISLRCASASSYGLRRRAQSQCSSLVSRFLQPFVLYVYRNLSAWKPTSFTLAPYITKFLRFISSREFSFNFRLLFMGYNAFLLPMATQLQCADTGAERSQI